MDFKQPNILFLKGISIEDIIEIEDIYHKELLNNINGINQNELHILYDKIPKTFTTIENWRRTTNLRCWYCTLKFKNTPWFIIENTNYSSNGPIYDINGNFCSVGCLQGYVNTMYNKMKDFDIYKSIKKVYKLFYHKQINEIIPSPSKYLLKIYGGDFEIIDYQREIQKINTQNIHNGY
jgi:hypothetical protein